MNDTQIQAFETVKTGKNVFLTGPAGSGKSYLIRAIVEWGESEDKKVGLTALTGCAALLLSNKAKTLHSWACIGLGKEPADVLAASILKNVKAKHRWRSTKILIIDEVSMMTPELFEKLDFIGKRVRGCAAPWGGLQLVLSGDYFQLPPVIRGMSGETVGPGRFAFQSPAWTAASLVPVVLTKIERQTDTAFQTLLNECRIGKPSKASVELLKSRQGLDWKSQFIRPTLLFSRNADVDVINAKNIAALNQPLFKYDAKTDIRQDPTNPVDIPTGEQFERYVNKLDNDANYAPHLELCKGCQVMLLVNMDIEAGLVNGSRGVVIEFREDGIPIVQFLQGEPIAINLHDWQSTECPALYRMQIPLRVAYAITIHKSQGATLDCALIDIGKSTFECGQAYVALSRVRNLEGMYVWNLDPTKIMAHPTVVEFYEQLAKPQETLKPAPYVLESGFGAELTDEGWRSLVQSWTGTTIGQSCLAKVKERAATTKVFPEQPQILSALTACPLNNVKVVILGQDPYHGAGQAHGLSFSVQPGVPLPPSLKNIRKELLSDLAQEETFWPTTTGTLTPWAQQGVLLLNAVLTVEESKPNSHADMGWEDLTQRLLGAVVSAHADDPLVFLAWGNYAQKVIDKLRLGPKHLVLASAHPSPLSAHRGFMGSKSFSKANAHLDAFGVQPIDWRLTR
jgi:ATP-dependent DNA helicase PIF1